MSVCFTLYKKPCFTYILSVFRLICLQVRTKPPVSKSTYKATPFLCLCPNSSFGSKSLNPNSEAKVSSLNFPLGTMWEGQILVGNLPSTDFLANGANVEGKVSPFSEENFRALTCFPTALPRGLQCQEIEVRFSRLLATVNMTYILSKYLVVWYQ